MRRIFRLAALLAVLAMLAVATIAAKPDPDSIPLVRVCETNEQSRQILASDEPFCIDARYNQLPIPIRAEHYRWWWQMDVLNSSFESTEICDGDGYLGLHWDQAPARHAPYILRHQEYLPENCVPGTYFLEIRWEERDQDGNVSYYETFIRRWVIPEEGK